MEKEIMELTELSQRESNILLILLRRYAETKKPVPSSYLYKVLGEKLSPSTIRLILNNLEKKGFLTKEHISSGRVPLDKAYRFFAETALKQISLIEMKNLPIDETTTNSEINRLAQKVVVTISERNRLLGFATSPSIYESKLKLCEFFPLTDKKIALFLVSSCGKFFEKIIDSKLPYSYDVLRTFSNYITQNFKGLSFREIKNILNKNIIKEREKVANWVTNALSLITPVISEIPLEVDLFLSGIEFLVDIPQLSPTTLKEILEAIEKKEKLLNLIEMIMENGKESTIVFGDEVPTLISNSPLVIASVNYGSEASGKGVVGVIGCKAMKYDETLSDLFRSAIILTKASIKNSLLWGGGKGV